MKLCRTLMILALLAAMAVGMPAAGHARVMMTATVNELAFSVLPTAIFTVDDWFSNPNLWSITVVNTGEGNKTVSRLVIAFSISNPAYGEIATGQIRVVGQSTSNYFRQSLAPGESYTVINTMINEKSSQVGTSGWSQEFKDEVLRIGYLPEGTYIMSFSVDERLSYYNNDPLDRIEAESVEEVLVIKNPQPPTLVAPDNMDENVTNQPKFVWQNPQVTDLSSLGRQVTVNYQLKLWKMFTDNGMVLTQEEAIARVPIWTVSNIPANPSGLTKIDFDNASSREELYSGRGYCWQVQGFDGTGRPVSLTNDGKSDIWQFTVQYEPLVINEPLLFYPLRFSWTPAQAQGGQVAYDVWVSENPDFPGPPTSEEQPMTSYRHSGEGVDDPTREYHIKIQARQGTIPLGEPVTMSFSLPAIEVTLMSPPDGAESPTKTPSFRWDTSGDHTFFVAVVDDETGDDDTSFPFTSTLIEGTSWTYDGPELQNGRTYTWRIAPANESGEQLGDGSETWQIRMPAAGQVTLVSPVNQRLDTIRPEFQWNRFGTGDNVEYQLTIMDDSGAEFFGTRVQGTSYTYPEGEQMMSYGARYTWTVQAFDGDNELSEVSQAAWFVTPFAESTGQEVTFTEVDESVKLVLSEYPQFDALKSLVLTEIIGEQGNITPTEFLDLLNKYRIVNMTVK